MRLKTDYHLNNMKEIYFKDEAREKLFDGINKLADAVSSTFGPNGATVIITDEYGKPYTTKDGVSVARSISFKDSVENIGAQLIKEVAERTVHQAGDGTTTSIVLAQAFINNLKDFNPNEVVKAFDEIIPKVIEQLKQNSRKLKNEDIKYVASISANNDLQIGELIQQAYNHSRIVKVEQSNNLEDSLELVEGMSLPVSYFSKHFITDESKGECSFTKPNVLLLDGKLENLKPFEIPIKAIAEKDEALVIITEDISQSVLRLIETNVLSHALKLCVIKAPGFSQHRKDLLQDLSGFTGATLINDFTKSYSMSILGKLESLNVSKNRSLLVKSEDINIDTQVKNLIDLRTTLNDYDVELVDQRIENLIGKISMIKVGGGSEIEMKERFDRYDDAVKATACALEEGIVEGAGIALMYALPTDKEEYPPVDFSIYKSLNTPAIKIWRSTGKESFMKQGSMFDENIIDPLKVTRCALENAVSVAKTILSTNAVVLNERQWI